MLAIFAPLISWIFRGIVIKFVVLAGIFAVLEIVIPKAIEFIAPMIGTSSLSGAFSGMSGEVWFFLDFFALGFGVPLIISAYVTRFLIRRLPVIG